MAMTDIAARLREVRLRIEAACHAAQRDSGTVHLIAVSKGHGPEAIRAAYTAGQRDFGENYAQEIVQKASALRDLPDIRFHFIGNLQSNKAKLLVPVCHAVQTVAKTSAARALSERAQAVGHPLEVMIQVNVAGETQKAGLAPAELPALAQEIRILPGLHLSGLMTIPPADDEAASAQAYRTLASLAQSLGLSGLSMGMSDDLELAIREGATHVRIGTAIFGERSYRTT